MKDLDLEDLFLRERQIQSRSALIEHRVDIALNFSSFHLALIENLSNRRKKKKKRKGRWRRFPSRRDHCTRVERAWTSRLRGREVPSRDKKRLQCPISVCKTFSRFILFFARIQRDGRPCARDRNERDKRKAKKSRVNLLCAEPVPAFSHFYKLNPCPWP